MNIVNSSFFPLFAVLAFVAVVLLAEALYMMWNSYKGPEAKKIEKRLRALSAGSDQSARAKVLKNRLLSEVPAINRMLLAMPRAHSLDRLLLQSGLEWTVGNLITASIMAAGAGYFAIALTHWTLLIRCAVTLGAGSLPIGYVYWKRSRRLRDMERQIPDTLDLMSRAMRAGHSLPSGIQMAAEETADPIAGEFRITHDEINFGVSMQQALVNLSERVPITDLRYFVVAVLVQRDAGGNLSELLDNLSKLIRDRLKFHAKAKVLTTEGRMSGWVLCLLPFAIAGLLNFANHDFIAILWTDPAGIRITQIVLGMMAVGALWMYKLVKVRV
jgi:tight adherence protein B